MNCLWRSFYLCLLLLFALNIQAQIPARPIPPRLVNDFAGLLDQHQLISLEQDLIAFNDSTSNQICVVILDDLKGMDILDMAFGIGDHWQVGQSGFDNGVVLLIKTKTNTGGEIAIATGYGLEIVLTDALSKRIIENIMLPLFRQERYYQGIQAGLERIKELASTEYAEKSSEEDFLTAFAFFMLFVVFMVIIIVLLSKKNKTNGTGNNSGKGSLSDIAKAILLAGMTSGGRSRGSGSWGGNTGGFGGFGGGRFGGGGAKGGW